jgi:flagellar protein FlgJ
MTTPTQLQTTLPASSTTEADTTPAISPQERAKVEKAAEKFESLFIGEMLKQMRRTNAAFAAEDSPSQNRINQDMLEIADTAVAGALAGQRAFGIADAILKQLLPAPSASTAAAPVSAQSVTPAVSEAANHASYTAAPGRP